MKIVQVFLADCRGRLFLKKETQEAYWARTGQELEKAGIEPRKKEKGEKTGGGLAGCGKDLNKQKRGES